MRLLTILACLFCLTLVGAQAPPKLSDFLTGSGLQVKFGYKNEFLSKTSSRYLNVSLKDINLFNVGDPISGTDYGIGDDPVEFGDAPLTLKIGEGLTEIGGTLFSSIGVKPISLAGLGKANLRILAGYDGQLEKEKQSTGFIGIEWVPFGPHQAKMETFAGLSLRHERRTTPTNAIEETGTAAIRGRIGTGFTFAVSNERIEQIKRDLGKIAAVPADQIIDFLETLQEKRGIPWEALLHVGLADAINDSGVQMLDADRRAILGAATPPAQGTAQTEIDRKRAELKQLINALPDVDRAAIVQQLKLGLLGTLEAKVQLLKQRQLIAPNNPKLSLYVEFDGSLNFGDNIAGERTRACYSLNVRYSFNAEDENAPYIWLRYENGRTRAEPDKQLSTLLLMGSVKF